MLSVSRKTQLRKSQPSTSISGAASAKTPSKFTVINMASCLAKFVLVAIYLGVVSAVGDKGDVCSGLAGCSDAGTTCFKGRCVCWVDMSFSVGMTWACDVDSACEILFPGHVCRPSTQCTKFPQKQGYCQPIEALSPLDPARAPTISKFVQTLGIPNRVR